MSDPVTLASLVRYANGLAGTNTRSTPQEGREAVQRALGWYWLRVASGYEGFAIRETEFLSPTNGDILDIQAGQGGANGTDPIVRGVFQVRELHRSLSAGDASGRLYPTEFLPLTTYRDRYGVQAVGDENNEVSRPGYYAYRQDEDGVTKDVLKVRPFFQGAERLLLTYTPTVIKLVNDSDTLEAGNNADEVVATRAAYHLTSAQDRQQAAILKQESQSLLVKYIDGYKGKRDVNGPDAVDKYRRSGNRNGYRLGGR